MSSADDLTIPQEGEICIDATQLRPGVHVRLPLSWVLHPFLLNSFVISDDEQVRTIQEMNLPRIFCDPSRCRQPPLPSDLQASAELPVGDPESEALRAAAAARAAGQLARERAMSELRERLDKAQQHYLGAARTVSNAMRGFTANPQEAVQQMDLVSAKTVAALLADPDSALALIAEKAQDDGHAAHALSVMTLALLLGNRAGLPAAALRALGVGALLHDIGKIEISPAILRSSERNRHEEALYQSHCRHGYEQARRAGNLTAAMLDGILRHHERCDGSGFPDRLRGSAIPLAARVIAIANRFDNLVNPLDFRRAASPAEALSHLWAREQKGFDTALLQVFVRAMGVYPPGSLVQLSDGRIGAVVASASVATPLCPQVLIFAPEIPRRQGLIVDLATTSDVRVERPLRLQDRSAEELDYLLPRRKINWSVLANAQGGPGQG